MQDVPNFTGRNKISKNVLYDSDGPDKYLHYSLVSFKDGTKIYDPNYDIEKKMPEWFSMDI